MEFCFNFPYICLFFSLLFVFLLSAEEYSRFKKQKNIGHTKEHDKDNEIQCPGSDKNPHFLYPLKHLNFLKFRPSAPYNFLHLSNFLQQKREAHLPSQVNVCFSERSEYHTVKLSKLR